MISWWIDNHSRVITERDAISHLEEESEWLSAVVWRIFKEKLSCECIINVHEHDYFVRLTYPDLFPTLPPEVLQLDPTQIRSTHQYRNGTFCLEWGSDNWEPHITGADMLKSTYHLLYHETPREDTSLPSIPVPSRHSLTIGQELRGEFWRTIVSSSWMEYACTISLNQYAMVNVTIQTAHPIDCCVCVPTSIKNGDSEWTDPSLPFLFKMQNRTNMSGILLKTSVSTNALLNIHSVEEIMNFFIMAGLNGWPDSNDFLAHSGFYHIFCLDEQNKLKHFVINKANDSTIVYISQILWDDRMVPRLPMEITRLGEKTVAIIGLGSVGSKIAISLVRSGIRKILLIDPDVMMPGNIVRHALDWKSIGFHKVKALREEMMSLAPEMEVDVESIQIAGQESNTVAARVIEKLINYDLIVDATAESDVFNLLASITFQLKIPLVWGQVYSGGIGGFIARSRPEIGLNPLMVRNAYLNYCEKTDIPNYLLDNVGYTTGGDQPMEASDADVSIIAHHMAQFIMDLLINRDCIDFPENLYLIGLKRGWVFEFPFQNHAIRVEYQQGSSNDIEDDADITNEDKETEWTHFMRELQSNNRNADTNTD